MVRRIAAIIDTNEVSGPGRQLVSLATSLSKLGVRLTILLLNRPGASIRFYDFARDHGVDCTIVCDKGAFDPMVVSNVRGELFRIRPDVVQTHGYKPTGIAFSLRMLGAKFRWVGFFEGETKKDLKDQIYTKAGLMMLRLADIVVVMSNLQRETFPSALQPRVHVVYNAVPDIGKANGAALLPPVLRRSRGEDSVLLIGVVGRLSREKGVDIFLDSFARLALRSCIVQGVVVGEGALRQHLEAEVERLSLRERVFFTGHVSDIASVYAALDLMVIPSRSEGLPSALLEALQSDLPVVSTGVGAMIEIAASYPLAIELVPPARPDLLAQGIENALEGLYSPERSAARRMVVAAFGPEIRCQRMLSIYDQANVLAFGDT